MKKEDEYEAVYLSKILFEYLYISDPLIKADAVMGFGHFDKKIPVHCGKIYSDGYAGFLIFTGGIGAGSTGLTKPEAQTFHDLLNLMFPSIPDEKVIIEDLSTNTGENIRFTIDLLREKNPEFSFLRDNIKLILVANAYRQRRVWLTCRLHLPQITLINNPPSTSFETELEMFENAGEDFHSHLVHEIERLASYPGRGFIADNEIPESITMTMEKLKKLL